MIDDEDDLHEEAADLISEHLSRLIAYARGASEGQSGATQFFTEPIGDSVLPTRGADEYDARFYRRLSDAAAKLHRNPYAFWYGEWEASSVGESVALRIAFIMAVESVDERIRQAEGERLKALSDLRDFLIEHESATSRYSMLYLIYRSDGRQSIFDPLAEPDVDNDDSFRKMIESCRSTSTWF